MDLAKYVIPTMEAVEVNDISEDNVPHGLIIAMKNN
jgi:hypothetical protein